MTPIESMIEAQEALNVLIHRSLHILSAMDYISSISISRAKTQIKAMQRAFNEDMDIWFKRSRQITYHPTIRQSGEFSYLSKLEARWHVCKIWINFRPYGEMHITQYTSARRVFEIISMLYGKSATTSLPFEVDTGLPPILHFILMHSSNFDFRLAALDLFRDKFWFERKTPDCQALYVARKQAMQKDFGVILGPD